MYQPNPGVQQGPYALPGGQGGYSMPQDDPTDIIARLLGRAPSSPGGVGQFHPAQPVMSHTPSQSMPVHPMSDHRFMAGAMHGSPRAQLNAMANAQAVARTLQHLRRLRPAQMPMPAQDQHISPGLQMAPMPGVQF